MEDAPVKLLAAALVCVSCSITYLASNRQRLLPGPIAKKSAWIVFTLLQLAAIWLLTGIYGPVAAPLLVLVLAMCLWIGLVLVSAHLDGRPLLVSSLALALFSLIMVTG